MEKRTDRELMELVVRVLACIHGGELDKLLPMCTPDALLKYGHRCGMLKNSAPDIGTLPGAAAAGSASEIFSQEHYIRQLGADDVVVAGAYEAGWVDAAGPLRWDYTIIFSGKKAAYIQLAFHPPAARRHRVSAVDKAVYYLYESDLLYLEVYRDHLHWHYRSQTIESLGTLSGIAERLSEDFVRVHRCYIVNRNHVAAIRRCGAKQCALTMVNGDVIPIPYKKYVECRNRLTR